MQLTETLVLEAISSFLRSMWSRQKKGFVSKFFGIFIQKLFTATICYPRFCNYGAGLKNIVVSASHCIKSLGEAIQVLHTRVLSSIVFNSVPWSLLYFPNTCKFWVVALNLICMSVCLHCSRSCSCSRHDLHFTTFFYVVFLFHWFAWSQKVQ